MKNIICYILTLLFLNQAFSQDDKSITVSQFKDNPSEKKYALIMGNSDYIVYETLGSPKTDVENMSAALTALGFEVKPYTNLTLDDMLLKIDSFVDYITGAEIAIIYYSGHGVELNNKNYLVPIDANLTNQSQTHKLLSLDNQLITKIGESTAKVKIVLLDACRDTPKGLKSVKSGSNLGFGDVTYSFEEFFIGFATAPGKVAIDNGKDKLSPYTDAIIKFIGEKGLTLDQVFNRVTNHVKSQTGGFQSPWKNVSMSQDIYLAGKNFNPVSSFSSLKIYAAIPGSISIDGKKYGDIKKDEILVIDSIKSGQHFVQLNSADDSIITETVKIDASASITVKFEIKITDKDKDNIQDAFDKCPDFYGTPCTNGCPDKDADCIADKDDNCPDAKGPNSTKGCPDSDGDGIADKDDNCPYAKGPNSTKGCPDSDEDGIVDNIDVCPNIKGPACTNGCPDKDQDCIADKDDNCPNLKGPASTKGCPDSDEDGIVDNIDVCPNIKGPASTKGCPDSDGDGIADKDDKCPTQAGEKVTYGCPDFDNDGIVGTDDECPYQAGKKTTKGCPDFDNDDIADKDDFCPNEKGLISNNGCPEKVIAEIRYVPAHNCSLNITVCLNGENFVPIGNNFRIKVKEGRYRYSITGYINCINGIFPVNLNSKGEIYISENSILDISLGNFSTLFLTNTGTFR